jgi:hypothetical protein
MSFLKKWRDKNPDIVARAPPQVPPDLALTKLADLAISKQPEHALQTSSSTHTWIPYCPILLPPTPIPGFSLGSVRHSPPLSPRFGHSSAFCSATGSIYVFGGYSMSGGSYSNDVFLFSTEENTVTLLQCYGDIPSPRFKHISAVVGNVLLVWGGTAGEGYIDDLCLLNLGAFSSL